MHKAISFVHVFKIIFENHYKKTKSRRCLLLSFSTEIGNPGGRDGQGLSLSGWGRKETLMSGFLLSPHSSFRQAVSRNPEKTLPLQRATFLMDYP